jgi:2,4-dienoyl-CoA reductase-like NADH-dependent reductase (Old Yellow Enzyme family)/thioredoxin reductase
MGSYEHLFTPLKIGRLTVKNRIESSPALPFLASTDYCVTRELIEWNRAIAQGGAAIVTIGDTAVNFEDVVKHAHSHTLYLGDDKIVNGLSTLVETIHRYGAVASIELNFRGLCPPAEMTKAQITEAINSFAAAAKRCADAGMEMIMIHGGHGHLIGQFFSSAANTRSDEYGGGFRNRARFAGEVLEAIRGKAGDRVAIEYRISAEEFVPGAPSVEETIQFAATIQDKIDLLHVSAGCLYAPQSAVRMIQPIYLPRGINVHYAERFKKAVEIPVTTVGSLTMEMAEEIVAGNKADMVAMIRTIIADPDCVRKAKNGAGDTIRPCVRCNTCLARSRSYFLPTRCTVNPVAGREIDFVNPPPPVARKKVVVIGGGPGGMEAARTAAQRGHEVVLFEKGDELGGTIIAGASPPFKEDMKRYLDWARRMTTGVPRLDVRLSTEATPEIVEAERPDVLILSVGATPRIPVLPGIERKNVVWAGDVDLGTAEVGPVILVAGAGLTGSETALHLVRSGRKVTIIDMLSLDQIAADGPFVNIMALWDMLRESNVDLRPEVRLDAVTDAGAVTVDKSGTRETVVCDTVVLALGVVPRRDVVGRFENLAPEVYVIGDCKRDRGNLRFAAMDGFNAAMNI